MSRREFLHTGSVAGTAVAGLSLARSVHAAGSDVIRIGMVGCGGRCSGAAGDAMSADPSVRLVAMSDLFANRVQSSRTVLKGKNPEQVQVDDEHCFVGLDGYKKVIDSVDVVLIACAAKFHPMYVKAAIEAGKHVFVEKPPAIDPHGIKVLKQACELAKQKNLGVLSGLQSRFHSAIRETVKRVQDGQIGEIVSIEENFIRSPYGATTRPQGMRELEIQYGNQYRFSWLCGDDVTQSLVHSIDRATWAMKETPPVKCHGMGGRSGVQNLLGDVFDHHSVVYHYANGVRLYAFCRTTRACYNEVSDVILGSRGTAYPVRSANSVRHYGLISGPNEWRYRGNGESPYLAEHREFLQSIRAGKPLNCGDYMIRSTLVCIMGQLSCYSGQEVSWEQVSNSDYCFLPKPEDCTWDMDPPTAPDANGVYPVCATSGMTKNVSSEGPSTFRPYEGGWPRLPRPDCRPVCALEDGVITATSMCGFSKRIRLSSCFAWTITASARRNLRLKSAMRWEPWRVGDDVVAHMAAANAARRNISVPSWDMRAFYEWALTAYDMPEGPYYVTAAAMWCTRMDYGLPVEVPVVSPFKFAPQPEQKHAPSSRR